MKRLIDPILLKSMLAIDNITGNHHNIEELIDSIPSYDYVKHGHWTGDHTWTSVCSECLRSVDTNARGFYKYCPLRNADAGV